MRARGRGGDATSAGLHGAYEKAWRLHPAAKEPPEETGRRLAIVENDDVSYAVTDALVVHTETGCPVVVRHLQPFLPEPESSPCARRCTGAQNGPMQRNRRSIIHPPPNFEPIIEKEARLA